MKILRGEKIHYFALLTETKELHFMEIEIQPSFIEEECRQSFQKGEVNGEKRGYEKAFEEVKNLLELLQTLAQKLLGQNKKLLEQLKPEVVEFAITLCEKMIRKELSKPEVMVNLINSLLVTSADLSHDVVKIVLAPEDLIMLEAYMNKIQYDKREIKGISFRTDTLMPRGDCRIETQAGLINYSIARELADLQSKVLQR